MSLPIRTTIEDISDLCRYFTSKPTGATIQDAKAVLGKQRLDTRKLSALKFWGLIEEHDNGRYKATEDGRLLTKGPGQQASVLINVIRRVPPYNAMIERAAHQHEDSAAATEVASMWHDHFETEVGDSDTTLRDQAVCFFQVASAAGLGNLTIGRRGAPTRFSFNAEALKQYISLCSATQPPSPISEEPLQKNLETGDDIIQKEQTKEDSIPTTDANVQGIFIAHGKNKKPLEQLKKILDQFKIPYKVAVEQPNLGRPISSKIREIMESCNCAILIFTADEEFSDKVGNTIWRPSENVIYELGATGYLYDNRIVIMKEDGVSFPSNFQDIGYICFAKDELSAKALDILKELIGFGIVKVST